MTIDGRTVRLASLRGKVVFLNFWATWCVPCREEMPAMERVQHALPPERFRILAVNMQEPRAEIEGFIRDLKLTFDVILDPTGDLAQSYGVTVLPTTYIIDGKGRIVARALGERPWDASAYVDALREIVRLAARDRPATERPQ